MEEQLVIVLVPSHPTAAHYLHFGGERWVDFSSWMTFREAPELGKDTELQTLEPAEKSQLMGAGA